MNKSMSAIGFKTIEKKRKVISDMVKSISQNPDKTVSCRKKDGRTSIEQYGYIGESFGIVLYGAINVNDEIQIRRWNVFAFSENSIHLSNVSFEKLPNGNVYAFCEDEYTGTELEFRLNNVIDYERFKNKQKMVSMSEAVANVVALGSVGNVIFPVEKSEAAIKTRAEETRTRRELIKRLRKGDESAEQKLFDHSIEIAFAVRERLKNEDILSVFEGYFLPYGETDGTYALLGDIIAVEEQNNNITGESIYNISLDVTGVKIQILINKGDVVGLPMEGMRFMGICCLQGTIDFS